MPEQTLEWRSKYSVSSKVIILKLSLCIPRRHRSLAVQRRSFITSELDGVKCKLYLSSRFTAGDKATHWVGDWGVPRTIPDGLEKREIFTSPWTWTRFLILLFRGPITTLFRLLRPDGKLCVKQVTVSFFFLHSLFRASLQLFQNNYQQDDTFGLSFTSGLVVLHSTCFELQGAHHQVFHFFTVQAASGILCNLLLYCTRSPTCSVSSCW